MKTNHQIIRNTIYAVCIAAVLCACGKEETRQGTDAGIQREQDAVQDTVEAEEGENLPPSEVMDEPEEETAREPGENGMPEEVLEPEDGSDVLAEPDGWRAAYLEYLSQTELEIPVPCTYSLIYVDGDDIPEVVIDTGVEAGGCSILTYHDGSVDELQTMRLNFTYIERGNLLCNADGNMGYYYDTVYSIRDGKWIYVDGGEYGDGPDGIQFDDDGVPITVYSWNEQDVSEEEYNRRLEAIYPSQNAVYPERYYILNDFRALISTGEVASADHRYELAVQDLTWQEAEALCRDRGGYLATITSVEELERIQAQMEAEDKTDITFYVGADNERGKDSFGYHWTEADGTTYNMLDHYNALFAFWMKGEPSYTGLTEDGVEVEEAYVVLLYRKAEARCYLNDVPNDILSAAPSYAGRIGYICEYDM